MVRNKETKKTNKNVSTPYIYKYIYNNESGCHLLGSWLVVDLNTHVYHHRFGSFFLAYIAFMCVRARSAEKYDASKD